MRAVDNTLAIHEVDTCHILGLSATSIDREVVVVADTCAEHFLLPIGIVVIHLVLGERRIVVEFWNIRRGITQRRIEILLFQQHRVFVTIEHVVTRRLIGGSKAIAVVDTRLSTCTTLGLDFNDTI